MDEIREPFDATVWTDAAKAWETVNRLVSGFFVLASELVPAGRILSNAITTTNWYCGKTTMIIIRL